MKIFKKFMASLLVSVMTLSGLSTGAFAEDVTTDTDAEFNLALAYNSELGSVEIQKSSEETQEPTQRMARVGGATSWIATTETVVDANTEYINDDNIQVSTLYKTLTKGASATINGINYTQSIQIRLNAEPGETLDEKADNTPLIIKPKTSGTFTYVYRRQPNSDASYIAGDGKDLKISKKESNNTYTLQTGKLNLESTTADGKYGFCTQSVDLEGDQEYVMWAFNTTGLLMGFTFEPKEITKVKAGDTVTIKSTPSENALIGEVSIDDDETKLTKNEGYTECTFVMPAKNVNAKVDFINESVKDEINNLLTFDMFKGNNTAENNIIEDLELSQIPGVQFSIGYADLKWESSNSDIISISGIVNTNSQNNEVTITAVCTFQDYTNLRITKDFNLTVPADTDDAGAIATAKEALTLGNTSAVKNNITLPAKGRRGTTIEWSSDNTAVIDVLTLDGALVAKVTRQKEIDTDVVLTATISRNDTKDTKTFNVKVLGYTPVEINRVAISKDGRVISAPMDGGYVSHIAYVDSISDADRNNNEVLIAAVYENEKLTSYKVFNLKDTTVNVGEETILKLEETDLPINENSEIKVFALDSMANMKPIMKEAYTYESTVKDGATIYVAGDSTACKYDATSNSSRFPQTGWAQVFDNFFTNDIKIEDLALSGRSSKDFRGEANYSTIMNGLKSGDYFIIQFGHNDSKDEEARYTDPNGDRFTDGSYKHSIYQYYVLPALEKGANPIIATSISRNKTSDAGLEAYVNAAEELANELGLPYIDLYEKTNSYINEVGVEKAKELYFFVKPNDNRFLADTALPESFQQSLGKTNMSEVGAFNSNAEGNYVENDSKKKGDSTHLQYFGAQMVSQWCCDELEAIGHPLTQKRSIHKVTLDDIPAMPAG